MSAMLILCDAEFFKALDVAFLGQRIPRSSRNRGAVRRALAITRAAVLALGVFLLPPVSHAIHTVIDTVMSLPPHDIGHLGFISPAQGQPAALTQSQSDALNRYNAALNDF
jgi:hypothetical protein